MKKTTSFSTNTVGKIPQYFEKNIWIFDAALVLVLMFMWLTRDTVLFFHFIFIILTSGAFFWKLRAFSWRAGLWITISIIVVATAVYSGQTQAAELSEIPLMSVILLIVFLIAQQRSQVEKSLRDSEEKYATLYDNVFKSSGEAIFVVNDDGMIIDVNQAMQDMFGYTKEEFLGKNFQTSYVVEPLQENFQEILREKGLIKNAEVVLRKKNGDFMNCLFTANIWRSANDEVLGYQGIIRDMTASRRRAARREALLKAEQEQRLLAETLGEVFLSLTAHTSHEAVLEEILAQAKHVLPYSAANIALVTNNLLVVSRQYGYEAMTDRETPFDFTHLLVDLPLDAKAIETQRPIVIGNTQQHPLWVTIPETAWIKSSIMVPICIHQRAIGLLRLDSDQPERFSEQDIAVLQPLARAAAIALENSRLYEQAQQELAERRHVEKALRKLADKNQAILDILPDSLFHIRRDGTLLDVKLAEHDVIRSLMPNPRRYASLDDMPMPELRGKLKQHIEAALQTHTTQIFDYQILSTKPPRDFEIWLVASGIDEVFAIVRDVTQRKAREAAIIEERTRIARDLHDSLGNNLAYLILKLGMLAEKNALKNVEQVQKELIHMRTLTDQAYQVVRNILAATLPSNAADFADALMVQARTTAERAGFKVNLSSRGRPHHLSALVQQQLLYLFTEALNNVEKHAAAKNVNISLVWTDTTLTVSLADDGRGLPVEVPPLKGHFGLNIMQQRAMEINGQLNLTSEPGEGTEIVIRLPLVQDSAAVLTELEREASR